MDSDSNTDVSVGDYGPNNTHRSRSPSNSSQKPDRTHVFSKSHTQGTADAVKVYQDDDQNRQGEAPRKNQSGALPKTNKYNRKQAKHNGCGGQNTS